MRQLSEDVHVFRCRLLDALDRVTPDGFGFVGADVATHGCPMCGGILAVRFHGYAAAADLECIDHGCEESTIVAALRGKAAA